MSADISSGMSEQRKVAHHLAQEWDRDDGLAAFREEFLFPKVPLSASPGLAGTDVLYFAGNSLGLQPKKAKQYVEEELEDWARFAVEGHFRARHPWMPYHEFMTEKLARVVGAKTTEVVAMNTLTVNLHLMMVSFYRPASDRYKIVIERGAFPSDQYAVASQAAFHAPKSGFDPRHAIVELTPRPGEDCLRDDDILEALEREGKSVALVLLGNVNYLTGQAFDVAAITRKARDIGAYVGFDFAHAVGNLELKLHDWAPDFAVWCSYKYLNSGPGAIAGCFVHERHHGDRTLPRWAGWWGHNKTTRFLMGSEFDPIPTAEAWQLSNQPILSLAPMRASLEIFDAAGMSELRKKSVKLTAFLEGLLKEVSGVTVVTPAEPERRGVQLSLRVGSDPKGFSKALEKWGVIADAREPDIVRVAPAPLYTRFEDLVRLTAAIEAVASQKR
ncbi:MAG: hypothetical protein RJB38_775 [Pseudomonadota bacterium]|jgi:kynureninase